MAYNPGISYRGDLHISQGFRGLGRGIENVGAMMGQQKEEDKQLQQDAKTYDFLAKQGYIDAADLMGMSPREKSNQVRGLMDATRIGSQIQQMDYQKLMGRNLENKMNAPPEPDWNMQENLIDVDGDRRPDFLMGPNRNLMTIPRPDAGGFSPYQQYQMDRNFQQDRNRQLGGTSTLPGDNVDQYIARTYNSTGKLVGKKDPMFEQHIDYLNEQARALGRPPVFERPSPVEELMGGPGVKSGTKASPPVVEKKPLATVAAEAPPEVAAALKWLYDNPDNPAAAGVRARLVREGYLKE